MNLDPNDRHDETVIVALSDGYLDHGVTDHGSSASAGKRIRLQKHHVPDPSPSSPAFFPPPNELLMNDTIEIDENALDVSHHERPALK